MKNKKAVEHGRPAGERLEELLRLCERVIEYAGQSCLRAVWRRVGLRPLEKSGPHLC